MALSFSAKERKCPFSFVFSAENKNKKNEKSVGLYNR